MARRKDTPRGKPAGDTDLVPALRAALATADRALDELARGAKRKKAAKKRPVLP